MYQSASCRIPPCNCPPARRPLRRGTSKVAAWIVRQRILRIDFILRHLLKENNPRLISRLRRLNLRSRRESVDVSSIAFPIL